MNKQTPNAPADGAQWARAYGFIPYEVKNRDDFMSSKKKEGKKVKSFDPSSLTNLCTTLESFAEGEMDTLLGQGWAIDFPAEGKVLLKALKKEDKEASLPATELSQSPCLMNLYGKILALKGNYVEAGRVFREAALKLPEFSEPYGNLGALLWASGKRHEAFILFTESLVRNPRRTTAQLNFFDAGYELKEFASMAAVIKGVLAKVEDVLEFRHHLAICYYRMRQVEEAKGILKNILDKHHDDHEARDILKQIEEAEIREEL